METLSVSWIFEITARNVVLLTLWNGAFHLWFYKWRKQGRLKKYNANWMSSKNSTFLFRDQVWDNMFWSYSGALFWSAYECGLWWAYARDWISVTGTGDGVEPRRQCHQCFPVA